MAFSAADVKNLREMTGVGMMDCKKALTAADGDIDKAVEWLREKGLAAAQKKASRIAAEGMAYAAVVDGIGVIVEVNAESDFVAKNDLFVEYVKGVAAVIAKENPADLDALYACAYGNGKTVLEEQNDKVLVIGENIKVRRFARYGTGLSVPYVHMGGRIAVLVNLETESTDAAVIELGKDIAMQIAALNPTYMDKSDVSEEFIAKEKEIRLAQAKEDPKNAKKPDAIIERSSWAASVSTSRRSACCSSRSSRTTKSPSRITSPLSQSRSVPPSSSWATPALRRAKALRSVRMTSLRKSPSS